MIYSRSIVAALLLWSFSHQTFAQKEKGIESQVDSVVAHAIQQEAFPGCVIYAKQADTVLFFKSYGYHTYDSLRRVARNDIYDLASVTKATGATLALMKLYEDGLIHLDDPIDKYVIGLGKRFGSATLREALAHQAGFRPWIPYYQEAKRKNGRFKPKTVGDAGKDYDYSLSEDLFLHNDFYSSKIKKMIRTSEVSGEKKYKYSGLFFYLIPELVENVTGIPYDQYLYQYFFEPLKAETLVFNPLLIYDSAQIVPTENDTYFRMQQIHGNVHDEGAITMKGISGNAGLFSNAEDLARVWDMLLKEGLVDSVRYLKAETIRLFTTSQYPNNENRRGLGFDKPLLEYDSVASSVAKDASYKSYGHSGYTGTLVWVDPQYDFLFVFLTNRVYPTRENRNIYKLNVRPTIHQLLFDFFKKK